MRPHASLARFAAAAALLVAATGVQADTTPDHPAAMLIYPLVRVDRSLGIDTTIQLTNDAVVPVDVSCFYELNDLTCVGGMEGDSCDPPAACSGACEPRRVSLQVRLTRRQPLAWRVSTGLTVLPLDGVERVGLDGQSNQTTDVPGLGDGPLVATLRCVVVETGGRTPIPDNVLVGMATITSGGGTSPINADAVQYRAIGVPAAAGTPNGDDALQLGGAGAEYGACPNANLLDFFFSGSTAASGTEIADVDTVLVLVPCSSTGEAPGALTVQFVVFNEFSQRLSTSYRVTGQLVTPLDRIDTIYPDRSIFSVNVAGTVAGRTQIIGFGGGLHALALESHRQRQVPQVHSTAIEVSQVSRRSAGDRVILPPPACTGDCDADHVVSIDELITSVGIAIKASDAGRCRGADRNHDDQIGIDELVASVGAALRGCPSAIVLPTAKPNASPTPVLETPATSQGPEITFLGLASADDRPLEPAQTDGEGRPVYDVLSGQGFTLVVEARPGTSHRRIALRTYVATGEAPDLQLLASLPLGNGDPAVCEEDGTRGGIPAVADLAFSDAPATVAAMNDLGCRAYSREADTNPCTRAGEHAAEGRLFDFVKQGSVVQFCIPIAAPWALTAGESTVIAARVRDVGGAFGDVREVVVRVPQLPD